MFEKRHKRHFSDLLLRVITFLSAIKLMWQSTKFAVFLCSVTDISATVAPIGVKFCMMVHIGPGHKVSLLRLYPRGTPKSPILGLNFGHLTSSISKTVSRSVRCRKISATAGQLSNMYTMGR